jgi:predicted Zn-dependent peptidase
VTPDEVRALAAELFRPENLSLALVMPRERRETPEDHFDAIAL